jgi:hypothetical protein
LADGWFGPNDLWALDSLARAGFEYDSSIAPIGRTFADQPFRRTVHAHHAADRSIWELPISSVPVLGVPVPVAGGNYLRQLPAWLTRRAAARWVRTEAAPMVAYFHVWELDPDQPRLAVGGWMTQMRHYRNLHRMTDRWAELLGTYRFTSAADFLNLSTEPKTAGAARAPTWHDQDTTRSPIPVLAAVDPGDRPPVSIVVPCFNEEDILPYLANTLGRVRDALAPRYDVRFILVDDGSSDRTWDGLSATFGDKPGFELVKHEVNRGVAAAIQTGLRHASTEIVCSMDCDCTYDPLELEKMIPLLTPGVDLVTASPYHPQGQVRNVPGWRLTLSRGAAWLYRRTLRTKLHTYTSCFRVYRKSTVADLPVENGRYLGVAELVGRLDLAGGAIVEYPATLEVRMLGRSKMKTVRTIVGHLGLMAKLAATRFKRWWKPAPKSAPVVTLDRVRPPKTAEIASGETVVSAPAMTEQKAGV